jgi:hypothetical protein
MQSDEVFRLYVVGSIEPGQPPLQIHLVVGKHILRFLSNLLDDEEIVGGLSIIDLEN